MVLFLTSSPGGHNWNPKTATELDGRNGLVDNLKKYWKENSRGLYIASNPEDDELNDIDSRLAFESFKLSGLSMSKMDICDNRNPKMSREILEQYDFVWLSGGHVPTENNFFQKINLKDAIKDYEGVVLSLSAGSMNCADTVYCMPELEGESVPEFDRFLQGLGLTDIQIVPHFYDIKDLTVDGINCITGIAAKDSEGQHFYVLPDGTYFIIEKNKTTLYGEAFILSDGNMTKICNDNEVKIINA